MISVNLTIVAGYVGDNPKVATTSNGKKRVSFSLATTERGYTTKDGNTIPDKTEWHSIVAWGGLADIAEKYIGKGSAIYVQGKNRTRTYDAADGTKRYITVIDAESIQFLDPKEKNFVGL